MKLSKKPLILLLGMVTSLASCSSDQESSDIPAIPAISLKSMRFVQVGEIRNLDTLIITLEYQDGDGDLGLTNDENDPRFDSEVIYYDSATSGELFEFTDRAIRYGYIDQYGEVVKTTLNDTLPEFNDINQCLYYRLISTEINESTIAYVNPNPNFYNIFVNFSRVTPDGLEPVVWETQNFKPGGSNQCASPLHGRFPPPEYNTNLLTPLAEPLKYEITSRAFIDFFGTGTFQTDIRIKDRALNSSNVVSARFTLDGLRRGEFELLQ